MTMQKYIFSLDSRTDLPKVRYATALDWFLLMSFFYCIATLLEFAGVHYFTKVGSGEINTLTDDEWEDVAETIEHAGSVQVSRDLSPSQSQLLGSTSARKRNSIICPIYNVNLSQLRRIFRFNHFFHRSKVYSQLNFKSLKIGSVDNVPNIITIHHGTDYTN